jgi:hypothetical protein
VYLEAPLSPNSHGSAIADPARILLELGQSGGAHPAERQPVLSLLARQLGAAGVETARYADLAAIEVLMLHPGRTLIEKLLRVNNFGADPAGRSSSPGWPRIGRQFYDLWALLGSDHVLALLTNWEQTAAIVADCLRISAAFQPDLPPPAGGFASCAAFDPNWEHAARLRAEHDRAMTDLCYGAVAAPSFEDVIARVHGHRELLDVNNTG